MIVDSGAPSISLGFAWSRLASSILQKHLVHVRFANPLLIVLVALSASFLAFASLVAASLSLAAGVVAFGSIAFDALLLVKLVTVCGLLPFTNFAVGKVLTDFFVVSPLKKFANPKIPSGSGVPVAGVSLFPPA